MLRDLLPANVRRWCYAIAGLFAVAASFIPGTWPRAVTAVLSAAGFGLAVGNIPTPAQGSGDE